MKILHIYTSLDGGGVERFLLNYYKHMNRKDFEFDIVVPGSDIGILERDFEELGAKIFHVSLFRDHKIEHLQEMIKIFKEGNYDIVHTHGYKSILGLIFAFIFGIKVRIIHSHMAFEKEKNFMKIKRQFVTLFSKLLSNVRWSCGIDAGNWLYGKNSYKNGYFQVIHNAIDSDDFLFNEKIRMKCRQNLGISDETFLVGNVARLSEQKNQKFLIETFLLLKNNPNIKLIIVGKGELEKELKSLVREYDLNNIIFLGARNDVSELLMAFDLFVLPSFYEGLPVSLIEAQASGLKSLSSDTITQEVNITKLVRYIDLKFGPKFWSNEILSLSKNMDTRLNIKYLEGTIYDIKLQALELENLYLNLERKFIN
ncbi:glycosyltransferase family 1 protein [Streptococcus catagoni]|uniref:glycosyltransferase family 1 protein n=1 Tax=Streptococcus catagoni TaxID=2654874 RepID=UPI00140E6CD8|nr:glycosyltransferase family 1 protein [Streptococcus catagoni]